MSRFKPSRERTRTVFCLQQLESRAMLAGDVVDGLSAEEGLIVEDDQLIGVTTNRRIYSIDGTGNNRKNADWGSTNEGLLRLTDAEYWDGISIPSGQDRLSAREISNMVVAQDGNVMNGRGLTDLAWLFGQFIDHDIDLTGGADPVEVFDIDVPAGDEYFDPTWAGDQSISLHRSVYFDWTGDSVDNPRQQYNQITAFIDGSVIYGSDAERAAALRTLKGGKLKTSDGDLLPFNTAGFDNAGGPSDSLFLAGDVRANENIALSAMHTIWVREHNRHAERIASNHPRYRDERIYQEARSIVIAELQSITFNEFLPAILGEDAISKYRGYKRRVNPGIANVFSTAIYRFGHSMLSSELQRLNNDGMVADEGPIPLKSAFFAPHEIIVNGVDSILKGASVQLAQEIDTLVVDDVRNFLFGPPGSGGFDLASLNIQRGRDHGLCDYNQVRADYGLKPAESFADITSDVEMQQKLEAAFGDVNNVDVWVGSLAEDHVAGASVGELALTVMVDQFERIRDGDRLWYERTFSERQVRMIQQTALADVIERNTDITGLQENVFFAADFEPDIPVRYYIYTTPSWLSPTSPPTDDDLPEESQLEEDLQKAPAIAQTTRAVLGEIEVLNSDSNSANMLGNENESEWTDLDCEAIDAALGERGQVRVRSKY